MAREPVDREAFELIYQRQVDTVYRLCFSFLKSRADTEDAVQAIFLKLLTSGKTFDSAEHEKAWLITVSSNYCKNILQHWWRRREALDDCFASAASEGRTDVDMDVVRAILRLPARCKTVVYLYYYEGYSTQEIAELLSRPVSTVRNQLCDGRKRLKLSLEEYRNE